MEDALTGTRTALDDVLSSETEPETEDAGYEASLSDLSFESSSSSSSDNEDSMDDAQRQWEQSVEELKQLCNLVIIPLAGKFMGRKFAYFAWAKYVAYQNGL